MTVPWWNAACQPPGVRRQIVARIVGRFSKSSR